MDKVVEETPTNDGEILTKEVIFSSLSDRLSEPNMKIFNTSIDITYDEKLDQHILIAPDNYLKQWIESKCLPIIQSTFPAATFSIKVEEASPQRSQLELFQQQHAIIRPSRFNKQFTFDKFIVGNNNRFAHAAACAVAKQPARAYNPLYIYGNVGIGKTHLLHAIANEISGKDLNVCLITSERFTNELINSIKNRKTQDFKNKYRSIDVLLIDDIQFLSGKESTQEEFFHTFNDLHAQYKQIVITSDCAPNEIPTLQDRLKTRFSWGLTADIQPPEFETRIAILRTKLDDRGINIDDDVLHYIASQIPNNVRELEGALNRMTAYANLMNISVSISIASKIIKDLVRKKNHPPLTIPQIKKVVADAFTISIDDLASKSRTKDIALARQISMFLSREITKVSLLKIGEHFGNRDHTTVMHAIDKVKNLLTSNVDIQQKVKDLTQKLNRNST